MARDEQTATPRHKESLGQMIDQPVRVQPMENQQNDAGQNEGAQAAQNQAPAPQPSEGPEGGREAEGGAGPMRTLLAGFAERFQERVGPVLDPTRRAAEVLAQATESSAAQGLLPALRDAAHQLQVLIDKVAEQQAYVLIFGPLKSGKSTFMNAMCAAYVSEVTCLPAYPCMVYVSPAGADADGSQFVITRYDGREDNLTDRDRLHADVARAHEQLNARIREVENAGEEFDPAVHMPSAIRRIDVKVPAGDLDESGAVLVDTPGLYSRMKFGYDRMTREFRDAAACAIFIVKTDNLFLEQVFEEFQELLELFSRIFLIVNLDSTKKDLLPSGELTPSLEGENPHQIIDAFETLAMTGPLKEAADEGRLRIIPVDLLRAASARIRQVTGKGRTEEQGGEDQSAGGDGNAGGDFQHLLRELTDYLNSNEYLQAFLVDSLRRAETLTDELLQLSSNEAVEDLKQETWDLRQQQSQAKKESEALGRLQKVDWVSQGEGLHEALFQAAQNKRDGIEQSAREQATGAIDAWFDNDHSLHALNQNQIEPLLGRTRKQFVDLLGQALRQQIDNRPGGLDLSTSIHNDLHTAGIDLDQAAREVAGQLNIGETAQPGEKTQPHEAQATAAQGSADGEEAGELPSASALTPRQVPVRRRVVDWILFRRQTTLAQRLLGPESQPDHTVPAQEKTRRLGEHARQTMHQVEASQIGELTRQAVEQLPRRTARRYAAALRDALQQQLEHKRSTAADRVETLGGRLATSDRGLSSLSDLHEKADTTRQAVTELRADYAPAEAEAATGAAADAEQRNDHERVEQPEQAQSSE